MKNYEQHLKHTSLPVKAAKIDLTKEKYNNNTFNIKNKNVNSYGNLSYDRSIPNKNIYSNNTYQRKNNNKDSQSNYNISVKSENYNKDSSSLYSRSRKESNMTYDPTLKEKNLKAGITTVIEHFGGQRRKVDNYKNKSNDISKNKNRK